MEKMNPDNVELKYRIGFIPEPSPLDMLYELVEFLQSEGKDEFNEWELKSKTNSRVGSLAENLKYLIDGGYVVETAHLKYKVVDHPWN